MRTETPEAISRELELAEAEILWLRGIVRATVAALREHGYGGSARRIEDELRKGAPRGKR